MADQTETDIDDEEALPQTPQARRFRAGVDLDAKRPPDRHWGLEGWYRDWCAHSKPGWLDPLGGDWGLMRLEDNLRKFQGDQQVLRPIIALLRRLTREGVSPAAFLRYAVLSRVGFDYDWRSWDRLHGRALEAMTEAVIRLRTSAPFDKPLGGTRQINPEVVLVKYSLRPLARMPVSQLEDGNQMDAYVEAWQKLKLDHPMVVFFLRRNVFPFLYAQSGRIDVVQLTGLVRALPALEEAFRQRYPEALYGEAFQKQADGILIYGSDPEEALRIRRDRGMSDYALVQELRLFLRVLGRLLARESGLFLAGFLSKTIQESAGTDLGFRLERLLDLIGPAEGIRVYEWHVRRLRDKPDSQQENYLALIEANGGIDPEYRRAGDVFHDLPEDSVGVSARRAVEQHLEAHPELVDEVATWREDIFAGRDRGWGPQKFPGLDAAGEDFHHNLLRWTIRGLGTAFSRVKSSSYQDLWTRYAGASRAPSFEVRKELVLAMSAPPTPSGDPEIRRSLHLEFLVDHWNRLREPGQAPDAAAALFLRQSLLDREAADRLLTQSQDPDLTAAEKTKLGAQADRVRTKAETLEKVMEVYPKLTADLQRLTAVIVGAQALKHPEVLVPLLLAPYRDLPEFRDRLAFLEADLRMEIVTLDQLGWVQNLWDAVFALVRQDRGFQRAFRNATQVEDVLEPYLLTRKKSVSWEALDAAVRVLAQYTRLTGERSKWQTLWEKRSAVSAQRRTYVAVASKAPLDAYYGDMGGICLSEQPKAILHPGFHVLRLFDDAKQIVGEAVLVLNRRPIVSHDPAHPVWFLFAVNPLRSVLRTFGSEQQLEFYLTFRALARQIAGATGFPLALPGYRCPGILSNDGHLAELIRSWELSRGGRPVADAYGFALHYGEEAYAQALVLNPKE